MRSIFCALSVGISLLMLVSIPCFGADSGTPTIIYSTISSEGKSIAGINPDGSGQTGIAGDIDGFFAPAWSPDGKMVAMCGKKAGDNNESLYVINADGSNLTKLKEIAGEDCDEVEWSPDGKKIAFATAIGDISPTYSAYVIKADGTGLVSLGEGYYLVWNTDGSGIFMSDPSNNFKLTRIKPDGTEKTSLTQFKCFPQEISPDGTKLLFGGGEVPASMVAGYLGEDSKSGLFYGAHDGSGNFTLVFENTASPLMELYCDIGCSWSPDGESIVYDKYTPGTGMGVYIAKLDGSEERLLVSNARGPDWR